MVDTSVLEADVERRASSSLAWGTKQCECGEMVYSGDLKSPVARHAGSSPATRTI